MSARTQPGAAALPSTATLQIAIDGPAGSGKSTIAAALARDLALLHVDTGAMYRALTLAALEAGIALSDGTGLAALLSGARVSQQEGRTSWNGSDVEAAIRGPAVTAAVSHVSGHPAVRAAMVRRQRALCFGAPRGAVLEGRDIGTVVLPLAHCKLYLDASATERARRRAAQSGLDASAENVAAVLRDIERRDALDSTRTASPLQVAPDAHVVDTTGLALHEVVMRCAELARSSAPSPAWERGGARRRYQHLRYRVAKQSIRGFCSTAWGLRVRGALHQDLVESAIFASNHVSNLDPVAVGSALDHEVWYLAKRELFWPPFGWLIGRFNAIPIDRSTFDVVAFSQAADALARGDSVMIFPEGTRRSPGRPGPVKRGLALLALQSGRPYLPCFVAGTTTPLRALFRQAPLEVWIGPPVRLHALPTLRATLGEREIQSRIGQLFLRQLEALAELAGHPTAVAGVRPRPGSRTPADADPVAGRT